MNKPTNVLWTSKFNQLITASPIAIGNQLLIATQPSFRMAQHSNLIALDLESGQIVWQHRFEYALISGLQGYTLFETPRHPANRKELVDLGIVATQSSDLLHGQGGLYAFDETGDIFWQWHGEEKSYAAPIVQDMQLLTLTGTSTLAIVSPEGGGDESVTRIELPIKSSTASPAVGDGVGGNIAYIPCRAPELYAINLNGTELWHFRSAGHRRDWLDQTPVLADGLIFTVSRLGTVFALDADTGALQWQQPVSKNRPLSQPAIAGDHLYVGFRYGVTALDVNNGQRLWTFDTTRTVSAQPLIIGDIVYVGCEDHRFYALNRDSGEELWHIELERRINIAPILTPTSLIVIDRGGNIIALEPPALPEDEMARMSASTQFRKEDLAAKYVEWGNYAEAADLFLGIGKLEEAAEAYEQAENWQEAASIWQQLDMYGKRAEALEQVAIALTKQAVDDEEKASAWEKAGRAHAEIRQKEDRHRCEREVARHRRQPIMNIDIKVKELMLGKWARLSFVVKNDGFGAARHVSVELVDDRFEGRGEQSGTWVTLMSGKAYAHWLEIKPQAAGDAVPLQLGIEYLNRQDNIVRKEQTFYLAVTDESETKTKSSSNVYNIYGDMVGGDKMKGDKTGGDKITVGDVSDSTVAIGRESSASTEVG